MTIAFQVPDMTCGHCVKTITSAVNQAVPGAVVAVDLPAHRVFSVFPFPRDECLARSSPPEAACTLIAGVP